MGPGTPRSRLPSIWTQADAPRSSQEVSIVAQTALVTAETVDDPWRNAQRQFDAAADLLDWSRAYAPSSARPSAS